MTGSAKNNEYQTYEALVKARVLLKLNQLNPKAFKHSSNWIRLFYTTVKCWRNWRRNQLRVAMVRLIVRPSDYSYKSISICINIYN